FHRDHVATLTLHAPRHREIRVQGHVAAVAAVARGHGAHQRARVEHAVVEREVVDGNQIQAGVALQRPVAGAQDGCGREQVRLRLGRPDSAATSFRRALRADSGDADAWTGLGLALRRLGRRDDAIAALRRALRIAPDYADAEEELLGFSVAVAPRRQPRPDTASVPARTAGEGFEVRNGASWS